MSHMLPVYSSEIEAYRLPADATNMLPTSNNMFQKISIPDMLQRYGDPWSFNSAPNFCESGQAMIGSLALSLPFGANTTETMKLRSPSDDTMQSFVIGNGYSAYKGNPSSIGDLMAHAHQFNSSGLANRPSAVQNAMHSSSQSIQERLYSDQTLFGNGGEYGENHAWPSSNVGTELLLLPVSGEALGRTLPSNNDFNTQPSLPLYEMNQTSVPIAHDWRTPAQLSSAKNTLRFDRDNLLTVNTRQGQGLSLSLCSQQHTQPSNSHNMDMRTPEPSSFGIIRTSKYLKLAQQLLNEICNVNAKSGPKKVTQNWLNFPAVKEGATTDAADHGYKKSGCTVAEASVATLNGMPMHPEERNQLQMKKARLISMVEEVDKTYRQYKEHMQVAITSFEFVAGLGASTPYTAWARQEMSRHFRLLRDAISVQIEAVCMALGVDPSSVPVLCKGETPRLRILDQKLRHQRTLQQAGLLQQQPWRPQRGLPEFSVSVLRAWLFEHFLHPYPKDTEKLMLARQTGLSRSQVSNWFINARVRLWKPMIEEMYLEEGKQMEKPAATELAGSAAKSSATIRGGGNQKASCTIEGDIDSKEENAAKDPADVVSCSLSQHEPDQANSSDSEFLSYGKAANFRVEFNGRNVGGEEWKRTNAGVTLALGLQQSYMDMKQQNSKAPLSSYMGNHPQIGIAQQQRLSKFSW